MEVQKIIKIYENSRSTAPGGPYVLISGQSGKARYGHGKIQRFDVGQYMQESQAPQASREFSHKVAGIRLQTCESYTSTPPKPPSHSSARDAGSMGHLASLNQLKGVVWVARERSWITREVAHTHHLPDCSPDSPSA